MKKTKYIVTFDPLSWTGHGSYIVKENDELHTPYCVVLIPHAINKKLAKEYAKAKAQKIALALEFQDNVTKYLDKKK